MSIELRCLVPSIHSFQVALLCRCFTSTLILIQPFVFFCFSFFVEKLALVSDVQQSNTLLHQQMLVVIIGRKCWRRSISIVCFSWMRDVASACWPLSSTKFTAIHSILFNSMPFVCFPHGWIQSLFSFFFSFFFQLYQRVVNKQRQRCRIGSIVVFIPSIYEFLVSIWRLLASTGTMPGVKFNRKGPQVEWVTRCVHYLYICPSCLFLVRNLPRQRRLNNEQINWTTKQPQNVHRHNEYY